MSGGPGGIDGRDIEAFVEAIAWAGDVLAAPEVAARWAAPSVLAGYSVGGLAAHLLAGVARLEHALGDPVGDDAIVVDLVTFFGGNRIDRPSDLAEGLPAFLRHHGEEQAARGPAEIVRSFAARQARVRARLADSDGARLVPVFSVEHGATALSTYLRTRVVELVVHGDDLAASVGVTPRPLPGLVAEVTLGVVLELARARQGDMKVIRAFTRRERAEPSALWVF
jgi:uncharacterized protein (TIGR03083 family)